MKPLHIKGVIFDMDGLILDTEKLYQRFWKQASNELGYEMPQETALKLRSLDKHLAKEMLREYFGDGYDYEQVKALRVKMMADYVSRNGIEAKKGVRELVEYLEAHGYKTAVATATNLKRANEHLTLAGVRDCFDEVVCAADVEFGKPYPDVYLYACEQIGLKPEECIALEDSPNGVKSAYSAGCSVICVPDRGEVEDEVKDIIYAGAESLIDVIEIIENM